MGLNEQEAFFEAELTLSTKELSNNLFHYTTADTALLGILASGTLKLSPFQSTNDLWESRPLNPSISVHHDHKDRKVGFELWEEIDRYIRLYSKVACLTQDWELSDNILNRDALKGWAHLSQWAYYGEGHAGVCLRFDRETLIRSYTELDIPDARLFHGPVSYVSASRGHVLSAIDIGQIDEFGVDVVSSVFADTHRESIFFRKHSDWDNEAEYRLVLINQSLLPAYVNIRDALTGVFLGDAFPNDRIPALEEALDEYQNVEVFRIQFHNRILTLMPFKLQGFGPTEEVQTIVRNEPNRDGSYLERLTALRREIDAAEVRRTRAESLLIRELELMKAGIQSLGQEIANWPRVDVDFSDVISAVPNHLRSRKPGLSGECVHFEHGSLCVVRDLGTQAAYFSVAIAFQVLDEERLRLHGLASSEQSMSDGQKTTEFFRAVNEVGLSEGSEAISQMFEGLTKAVSNYRAVFDSVRELPSSAK